jgi:hypothetical protein
MVEMMGKIFGDLSEILFLLVLIGVFVLYAMTIISIISL